MAQERERERENLDKAEKGREAKITSKEKYSQWLDVTYGCNVEIL